MPDSALETTFICPITDAFMAHHGALGGFVRVWRKGNVPSQAIIDVVSAVDGVDLALGKDTARRLFDLPIDREAEVVVVGRKDVSIGSSSRLHDLAALKGHRLRTHGAISEAKVPFILNRPLNEAYREKAACRSIDSWRMLDFALNGIEP